ncbi:hypothetical protein SteCoe_32043 [Stentor coeruleus]|uniref:Uncharacterized protein n=1 Tax=Stentor coeruleus TaxID=5963 RepID=A0A1R2AZZ2_9CILI|nr:hypothetical protein SteCoe_32043 [Stentor coeruleus]
MSRSIIEDIILKDKIIVDESNIRSLIENQLALGCFIASIQTTDANLEILWILFMEKSIDKAMRGVILIKLLKVAKAYVENIDNSFQHFKNLGVKVIYDFARLSDELLTIADDISALLDLISSVYKDYFFTLINKFTVNDSLCVVASTGLKFQNMFNIESSLFKLSYSDLLILENWKRQSVQEILEVVEKGCKIVYENNLNPADPLSILVYVIFQTEFKNYRLNKSDAHYIEKIIRVYINNFSKKQKARLEQMYEEICKKFSIDPDYQIFRFSNRKNDYYSGLNEKNIRYTGRNREISSQRSRWDFRKRGQISNCFQNCEEHDYDYCDYDYSHGYDNQRDSSYYHSNIYESCMSFKNNNPEIFEKVNNRAQSIMVNLRNKAKFNEFIDENELLFQLQELAMISPIALFYIFEFYSRKEKDYIHSRKDKYPINVSLSIWVVIKNVIEKCDFLNEDEYNIIMDNICHLLESITA